MITLISKIFAELYLTFYWKIIMDIVYVAKTIYLRIGIYDDAIGSSHAGGLSKKMNNNNIFK